jgi:FkbM family methyltransferase
MKILYNIIKSILSKMGYTLVKNTQLPLLKASPQINPSTMKLALERIKSNNIEPNLIIDVGAAKGLWSKECSKIWPNSEYFLVEPIPEQFNLIPNNLGNTIKYQIIKGVCGSEKGKAKLTLTDDLDGSGLYGESEGKYIEVEVFTMDEILRDCGDKKIVVKLDTHGFENQIIDGAMSNIENVEAWIIEVYGFYVSPTAPLFHELSQRMFMLGYRLFDIIDIMRREKDKSFWQADAVFLKATHPIFKDNKYK